ncbi:hypothetical protein [Rufibacter tibetensis]|nr:hypothetical protein [Rufibacter tibetensis]
MGIDGLYRVEVVGQLGSCDCVYHIVADSEDYEFAMYQFLESDSCVIPQSINVLLVYFDGQLGVYTTMGVKVKLEMIKVDFEIPNDSGEVSHYVMQFQEFVLKPTSY